MPVPKSDRAGQAQLARRHREGRHKEPRDACPLCHPENAPAGKRLAGWAADAADEVISAARRERTPGGR